MTDRLLGLLLFLPVPIVLALFTRAPLGVVPSILLGVALVLTHRLYARPFALRRASRRCLWCGGAVGESAAVIAVDEPGGRTEWTACRAGHLGKVARVLGWADRKRLFLRGGILGSLVLFLAAALLSASERFALLPFETASALFRLGIAVAVLPLGWLSLQGKGPADGTIRSPFPVHVPALPGLVVVLWLFRLVGIWWLAEGSWVLLGLAG